MRFDIERMCNLAGIGKSSTRTGSSGLLRESKYEEMDHFNEEEVDKEEDHLNEMDHFNEAEEVDEEEEEVDEEEEVEVDEVTLVQELRRMKKIVTEARKKAKKIASKKKESLQEAQLKAIIDQEVQNVLRDLNLSSGWIYGNKRPAQSKSGYVHQGSMLKGIGFK